MLSLSSLSRFFRGKAGAEAALSRWDAKTTRLYEQGASKRRLGLYLVRWFGWVGVVIGLSGVSYGSYSIEPLSICEGALEVPYNRAIIGSAASGLWIDAMINDMELMDCYDDYNEAMSDDTTSVITSSDPFCDGRKKKYLSKRFDIMYGATGSDLKKFIETYINHTFYQYFDMSRVSAAFPNDLYTWLESFTFEYIAARDLDIRAFDYKIVSANRIKEDRSEILRVLRGLQHGLRGTISKELSEQMIRSYAKEVESDTNGDTIFQKDLVTRIFSLFVSDKECGADQESSSTETSSPQSEKRTYIAMSLTCIDKFMLLKTDVAPPEKIFPDCNEWGKARCGEDVFGLGTRMTNWSPHWGKCLDCTYSMCK